MNITRSDSFENQYAKLPAHVRKKIDKQLFFLHQNSAYPSLRVKKMKGIDRFEARVDRSYRFTFTKTKDNLILLSVGPHDEGLGKK